MMARLYTGAQAGLVRRQTGSDHGRKTATATATATAKSRSEPWPWPWPWPILPCPDPEIPRTKPIRKPL